MDFKRCQDIHDGLLERLNKEDKGFCNKDCIALLLGAGCNCGAVPGCELPKWPKLLQKLSLRDEVIDSNHYLEAAGRIEEDIDSISREIVKQRFRELTLVPTQSMIDSTVAPETAYSMAKYVKLALESDIADKTAPLNSDSTMGCAIDVCVHRVQDNRRTIVITYNYDDLFESRLRMALDKAGYNADVTVCPADTLVDASELICGGKKDVLVGIIYVHGKIPIFDTNNGAFSGHVILSQQSYDHLSRNHLETANQIQYIVQAGTPMVAIGFSFDDFNFGRLRTDLMLSSVHLPVFYSLQYCDKEQSHCSSCNDCSQKKMVDQIRHIQTYDIYALPMPKDAIRKSFDAVFNY